MNKRIRSALTIWLPLTIGSILVLMPVYWMLVLALTPTGMSRGPALGIIPTEITFDNFLAAATERPLLTWMLNSTIVALSAATTAVAVGVCAGYAISRFKFRGAEVIALAILATEMIPSTSIVLPLYTIFSAAGLLNTQAAIVLGHMSTVIPLVLWLSKGFFDDIPIDLEHAAYVDGANRMQAFRLVALPLILPGILAAFVYAFIVSWSDLIFARTLSSTPLQWTVPVGLSSFNGEFYTSFEPMMAASIIFAAPVVLLFLLLQRHFIAGLTSGGIKG
jgi:ABC-type glycerol-3-phosphate transport system permease component